MNDFSATVDVIEAAVRHVIGVSWEPYLESGTYRVNGAGVLNSLFARVRHNTTHLSTKRRTQEATSDLG